MITSRKSPGKPMGGIPSFLSFDQVTKKFPDQVGDEIEVIRETTLDVREGELMVFLGPSGCGKTTLMRMAGGLDFPSSGRILLHGEEVEGPDRRKGMVFQSYSSFPWLTVRENVLFGMKYRHDLNIDDKRKRADRYIQLVGLGDFSDFYTNRISGGMRQRVAIARTLAADPEILLMDEPFGALDALTREFLQLQLLDINREERKTVIFVTHDVEEAVLLADRIIVFSARPARIIEDIAVVETLGDGPRSIDTKESDRFFQLRNRILHITREEAGRAARA
jgi:ABC-type nitrate/sulfonate/bicarbonate transport system ATPase subunit